MPTIDQLAPAPAASDLDAFPASQSGFVRRVTRAQILAGRNHNLRCQPEPYSAVTRVGLAARSPSALAMD